MTHHFGKISNELMSLITHNKNISEMPNDWNQILQYNKFQSHTAGT